MSKAAEGRTHVPITVVVGVVCLAVGTGGGVWFAQEVLPPPGGPIAAERGTAAASAPAAAHVVADARPSVAATAPGVRPVVVETMAPNIAATQESPEPAKPPEVASVPTERPRPRAGVLYTCPDAAHFESTSDQPGRCGRCGQQRVAATMVRHGLKAIAHFVASPTSQAARSTTQVASTRPKAEAAVGRPGPTAAQLYTCAQPAHIDVTGDQPGTCKHCGGHLVPATSVPHGLEAIARFSGMERKPVATRPALYTCFTVDHLDVTSDNPGQCLHCKRTLWPVEKVAHERRAIKAWNLRQTALRGGKMRVEPPVLYTCPDLAHVDVTTLRPGKCSRCELHMRRVDTVVHTVEAIRAFLKKVERGQ